MRRFIIARKTLGITDACKRVGEDLSMSERTVYDIQNRFRPTKAAAKQYLEANALRMTMKVVKKANVAQLIEILQAPNLAVIAQPKAADPGMTGSRFMVGVSVDSLGGVRVGISGGGIQSPALPAHPSGDVDSEPVEEVLEPYAEDEDVDEDDKPLNKWYEKDKKAPEPPPVPLVEGQIVGRSVRYRVAVAKAQRKDKAIEMKRTAADIKRRLDEQRRLLGMK